MIFSNLAYNWCCSYAYECGSCLQTDWLIDQLCPENVSTAWVRALCWMHGDHHVIFNCCCECCLRCRRSVVVYFGRKSCRQWCRRRRRKQRFWKHRCQTQICRSAQLNSFCWLYVPSVNSLLDSTCGRSSWTMNQLNPYVTICYWELCILHASQTNSTQ